MSGILPGDWPGGPGRGIADSREGYFALVIQGLERKLHFFVQQG